MKNLVILAIFPWSLGPLEMIPDLTIAHQS